MNWYALVMSNEEREALENEAAELGMKPEPWTDEDETRVTEIARLLASAE